MQLDGQFNLEVVRYFFKSDNRNFLHYPFKIVLFSKLFYNYTYVKRLFSFVIIIEVKAGSRNKSIHNLG